MLIPLASINFKWLNNMDRFLIIGLIIFICGQTYPSFAQTSTEIKMGDFSEAVIGDQLPKGWEPLVFKKIKNHTRYKLIKEAGINAIKAESDASASGLIHKKRIDPNKYPVLKWKWKINNILNNGDVFRKDGDDYSARIYIMFEYTSEGLSFFNKLKFQAAKLIYGEYPPTGALCYVWGNNAPKGTIVSNAYTDYLKMIVVESGKNKLNTWITEERNIINDYRKAFGRNPNHISGIALMTDSDNTGESAQAYYGDIILKKALK